MIPWTFLAILSAGVGLIFFAHLASFFGFDFSRRR